MMYKLSRVFKHICDITTLLFLYVNIIILSAIFKSFAITNANKSEKNNHCLSYIFLSANLSCAVHNLHMLACEERPV